MCAFHEHIHIYNYVKYIIIIIYTHIIMVLAVIVQFVTELRVKQHLRSPSKSVNGEELARELITILSVKRGIESSILF